MLTEIALAAALRLTTPTHELDGDVLTVRGADMVMISPVPASVLAGVRVDLDEGRVWADSGEVACVLEPGEYTIGAFYNIDPWPWDELAFSVTVEAEPPTRREQIRAAYRVMMDNWDAWNAYERAVAERDRLKPTYAETMDALRVLLIP